MLKMLENLRFEATYNIFMYDYWCTKHASRQAQKQGRVDDEFLSLFHSFRLN